MVLRSGDRVGIWDAASVLSQYCVRVDFVCFYHSLQGMIELTERHVGIYLFCRVVNGHQTPLIYKHLAPIQTDSIEQAVAISRRAIALCTLFSCLLISIAQTASFFPSSSSLASSYSSHFSSSLLIDS